MYTINDYIKYYKDYTIKDLKWNMMDNLLMSILVYMPINSFECKIFEEVINSILKIKKVSPDYDLMVPKVIEIANLLKDSIRYKDLKFRNFKNQVNKKAQFGAVTCTLYNIKVISFRGTDSSVIGWLENYRLAYSYPTYTHTLAINYLKENIKFFDNNVIVLGHSKGGNLALVSAMEMNNFKFNKISQVINFDGPGLRKDEYLSYKYNRVSSKLLNIIPTGSYVGSLLYNNNYKVVQSNEHAVNVHYPTSWCIFGICFVEGELSKLSKELLTRSTVNMDNIDREKFAEICENAFEIFKDKETSKMKIGVNDVSNLLKTIHKMDPELSKYIGSIFANILSIAKKKK